MTETNCKRNEAKDEHSTATHDNQVLITNPERIGNSWKEAEIKIQALSKYRMGILLILVTSGVIILTACTISSLIRGDKPTIDSIIEIVKTILVGALGWSLARSK